MIGILKNVKKVKKLDDIRHYEGVKERQDKEIDRELWSTLDSGPYSLRFSFPTYQGSLPDRFTRRLFRPATNDQYEVATI